jgi:hypothetical protein
MNNAKYQKENLNIGQNVIGRILNFPHVADNYLNSQINFANAFATCVIGQSNHHFLFIFGSFSSVADDPFVVFDSSVIRRRVPAAASGIADGSHGELNFLLGRFDRFAYLTGSFATSSRLIALMNNQCRWQINHIGSNIIVQIF